MNERDRNRVRLGFWAVLLLSVFAWAPTTYPGYWESLEGFQPVFNAVHHSAISSVAVEADLWRGAGSATYLIAQPFMLMGMTPVAAVRLTFAVALILGGLSIYVWMRDRWGDRSAGLAGLLFMLWPPLLATVYIRGSLSDALLMGLLSLALAGASINARRGSVSAAGVTAISLFWMWRTQAGMALLASILLLAYVLIVERSRITALIVALSAGAGFTSLLPFWNVRSQPHVDFFDNFVYPHQLMFGQWQVAPSQASWQDGYPFMLGIAMLTFTIIGLWAWLSRLAQWRDTMLPRSMAFSASATLLLILLATPLSEPLWRVSRLNILFTYPWQILLLAGPFLALMAGSIAFSIEDLSRSVLWTVLLSLTVLASLPYLTTEFTQVTPDANPVAIIGAANDIVILDAQLHESSNDSAANTVSPSVELTVTWQVLNTLPFDYNLFFQAVEQGEGSVNVVAQLDEQPLQGDQPPTTWQPGDIYTERYTLNLPGVETSDLSSLVYYFGLYDWRDGARLPVDGGIDDKVVFYGQ